MLTQFARASLAVCLVLGTLFATPECRASENHPETITLIPPSAGHPTWVTIPADHEAALSSSIDLKFLLRSGPRCKVVVTAGAPTELVGQKDEHAELVVSASELRRARPDSLTVEGKCEGAKSVKVIDAWPFATIPAATATPPATRAAAAECSGQLDERGPLVICGDDSASPHYKELGGTLPEAAVELGKVLAEIAVDRAKRKGFALIRARLETDLCTIKYGDLTVFKRSCSVIAAIRLADLAAQAQALQDALTQDLLYLVQASVDKRKNANVSALVGLASSTIKVSVVGGHIRVLLPDPKIVLDQIAATKWIYKDESQRPTLELALKVTRNCLFNLHQCKDVAALLDDPSIVTTPMTAAHRAKVAMLANLMIRAAVASSEQTAAERWRLAIQAVGEVMTLTGVSDTFAEPIVTLLCALVDADLASAVAAGSTLLEVAFAADGMEVLSTGGKKAFRVLTTVAAYAATYQRSGTASEVEKQQLADEQNRLHEVRKQLIEDLMDEVTDRSARDGDTILSVGINASFIAGGQKQRDSNGNLGDTKTMAPQLSLPLGVALDIGMAKHIGVHGMIYGADIAQFASYDGSDGVNSPRWDSFLTLGGQFGFMFGQESPAVLAFDIRYAPSLFAQTGAKDLSQRPGGALRFGITVGYYVPFLDFN